MIIYKSNKMAKQFATFIYIAFSPFIFHTTPNLFKHKSNYYFMLFIVLMQLEK